MAILNTEVETQNLTPDNDGFYRFTTTFHNLDDSQTSDPHFPIYSQTYNATTITHPMYIPVVVGDGSYVINDIKMKIVHKNKTSYFVLQNVVVNCTAPCGNIFPIISITTTSANTFLVTLSQTASASLTWRVRKTDQTLLSSGVVNVTSNSFTIIVSGITSGNYLLELEGASCVGKTAKSFYYAGGGLEPCGWGPSISEIQNVTPTSVRIKFNGGGIYGITWRIKQNGALVRSGLLKHETNALPGEPFFNSSTPTFTFAEIPAGTYILEIEGAYCQSAEVSISSFTVISTTPPPDPGNPDALVGGYINTFAGREISSNKALNVQLQYNNDGTISDATIGLTFDGITNVINGRRRYYQMGGKAFVNSTGTVYNRFQSVFLPDGIYSLMVYDVIPSEVPNVSVFIANLEGYNQKLSNTTCHFHDLRFAIHSTVKVGNGSVDPRLRFTRASLAHLIMAPKNWRAYHKWVAEGVRAFGITKQQYNALGVSIDSSGAMAFNTDKYWSSNYPSLTELYNAGVAAMNRMNQDVQSVLTTQYSEDLGGYAVLNDMWSFYKGAKDVLNGTGVQAIREMGLYGEYGDNKTISEYTLHNEGLPVHQQSLTTKVQDAYQFGGNGWVGKDQYYNEDYKYRNVNRKIYFSGLGRTTPYAAIYDQERLSLGTFAYGGRQICLYTMPYLEDLASANTPPIFAHSGELIPFPNGEILTRTPEYHAAHWDEMHTAGIWYTLISGGVINWGNGVELGTDTNKLQTFGNIDYLRWIPTGGGEQTYVSGQNGAPVSGENGLVNRPIAGCIDALLLGAEEIWKIRDRITTLRLIPYTSNLGGYTPTGGSNGTLLNTHTTKNENFFDFYHLVDLKKGIAIKGTGSAGNVVVYYNGWLSQHEYEDVTLDGQSFRVYGRQTVIKTY